MSKIYKHTDTRGRDYYLHKATITSRLGEDLSVYYFSSQIDEYACDLPDDVEVNENPRNGFLTIRRKSPEEREEL